MKKNRTDRIIPDARAEEIFFRAERDGRAFLAFRVTGIPSRNSGARIASMMTETGILARPAKQGSAEKGKPAPFELADWKIERRDLSEGEWVFMGPDFPGVSLQAMLASVRSEESAAAFLSALARVARALGTIEKAKGKVPPFSAASVVLGGSGDVLLLPRSLARGGTVQSRQALTGFARIDADPRKTPAHFVAAAAREAAVLADGGRRDPRADALALSKIAPRLHPALLAADESWRKDRGGIGLEGWAEALEAASPSFFRQGAATEDEKARKEKALARAGRIGAFMAFVSRRRGYLIAAAAAVATVAGVVSSVMGSRRDAMRFSAYEPEKIVSTFYSAYSELNDDDLSVCVKKGSLKEQTQAVINLGLVLKMRFATERRDSFLRAQAWLDAKKPPIAANDFIFGVTGLSVEPLGGQDEGARRSFRAAYTLWYTEPREDLAPGADMDADIMVYTSRKVIDLLTLEKTPSGWKVASLERDEGEPIIENVTIATQGRP